MKKRIFCIVGCLLVLLIVIAGLNRISYTRVIKDGVSYHLQNYGWRGFVGAWQWDGDPNHMEITIPDTVYGRRITSLGGTEGRGMTTCEIRYPSEWEISHYYVSSDEKRVLNQGKIVELDFKIMLGKNISKILFPRFQQYGEALDSFGNRVFYKPYVYITCSPENKTFYSEDGKLYYRKTGELVDRFFYR